MIQLCIDAPRILQTAWAVGRIVVPSNLQKAVEFVDTGNNPNWWRSFTDQSQLPSYLGGEVEDRTEVGFSYHDWLLSRVREDSLLY